MTNGPNQLARLTKHAMSSQSDFDLAHRGQLMRRAREVFSWERFGLECVQFYEETIAAIETS
jgi:hypothetical protein